MSESLLTILVRGADHVSYVTGTTDYLFLLAEFEYGSRTCASSAEKNYQKQYDYYKAGNSKVHNRFETESAVSAWTRSAYRLQRSFLPCRHTARPTPATRTLPGRWPRLPSNRRSILASSVPRKRAG